MRSMSRLAAGAVMGAVVASALLVGSPTSATTVCCYRYADASPSIRNQVRFSPSGIRIDWNRMYMASGDPYSTADARISTPAGVWATTGGGYYWVTIDVPGEVTNSRGRCMWTSSVPISGSIALTCEVKHWPS